MNIGWIFIICALLIFVIMVFRLLHTSERVSSRERPIGRSQQSGPDTESQLPIVDAPGDDVRRHVLESHTTYE